MDVAGVVERVGAGVTVFAVGDEVILLGTGEGLSVDALEHAELANSTPYEILCNISKRVPRKYGTSQQPA